TTEADVRDIRPIFQVNAQQHVRAGSHQLRRGVPQDSRREVRDLESQPLQQILLEAVAAAPGMHELLLEGSQIQARGPPQQRIEVFERNRERVPEVDRAQGLEYRCARTGVADALEIGIEVDHEAGLSRACRSYASEEVISMSA